MTHLSHQLYDNGLIKFGRFTLHSGVESPVYFDLRNLISYPDLMETVLDYYESHINLAEFDVIVGPAYGALIPGKKVLLVDDFLTSGASLKTISETLTEAGYHVVSALVLIDRRAWNQRTVCLNSIK